MTPSLLEFFFALSPVLDCAWLHGQGTFPQYTQRVAYVALRLARHWRLAVAEQEALAWTVILSVPPLEHCSRLPQLGIPARSFTLLCSLREAARKTAHLPEAVRVLALAKAIVRDRSALAEGVCAVRGKEEHCVWRCRQFPDAAAVLREAGFQEHLLSPRCVDSTFLVALEREFLSAWRHAASWKQLITAAFIVADRADTRFPWTRNRTRRLLRLVLLAWHRGTQRSGPVLDRTAERQQLQKLALAVCLHDLGMLTVPDAVLTATRRLTEAEMLHVRGHVWWLWEALRSLVGLEQVSRWAAEHHERYDASGYPWGRHGRDISLEGGILACADCAQSLLDGMPGRTAVSPRRAMLVLGGMAAHGRLHPSAAALVQRVLRDLYKEP